MNVHVGDDDEDKAVDKRGERVHAPRQADRKERERDAKRDGADKPHQAVHLGLVRGAVRLIEPHDHLRVHFRGPGVCERG